MRDWLVAWTSRNLGRIAHDFEEEAQAVAHLEESLRLTRRIGDTRGIALSLHYLGVLLVDSQPAQGQEYLAESIGLFRTIGDRRGLAWALHYLALVSVALGDIETALGAETESLTVRVELGDKRGIAESLEGHAIILTQQGNAEAAIRVFAAAATLRETISAPGAPADRQRAKVYLDLAIAAAGPRAEAAAWREGEVNTIEDVVAGLPR